jgi:hypothetical protein
MINGLWHIQKMLASKKYVDLTHEFAIARAQAACTLQHYSN